MGQGEPKGKPATDLTDELRKAVGSDGQPTILEKSHDEQPPATLSEAVLLVLWPIRKYPLGAVAIFLWLSLIGVLYFIPADERIPLVKYAYISIIKSFTPIPRLTLIVPTNLSLLSMSVASILETTVMQRTGILDLLTVTEAGRQNISSQAVLKFGVDYTENGLVVSPALSGASAQIIGSNTETLPKQFISDGAPFVIDALLYNLDVNWNTLTAERSPHRCRSAAFAMFDAAERVRAQDAHKRVELLRQAVEIDPNFATGFWALGSLLKEEGDASEADKAFETARKIDPEVPKIFDVDPTEAVMRDLKKSELKQVEPGLWAISIIQQDYDVGIWAWRFDLSRFAFELAEQDHETGENVQWFRAQPNMVLAFNAGFFEKDNVGRLSAGGLLAIEGVVRHQPWKEKRGGVLAISADGQMSVITQKDYPFSDLKARFAI